MNGFMKNKKERSFNRFFKNLISYSIITFVTFLAINLFYKQIIQHYSLYEKLENKSIIKFYVKADRGYFLDRNGNPIATNIDAYNLYVAKQMIKNKNDVANIIASNGILDYTTVLKKLNSKIEWIPIAYNINEDIALKMINRYNSILIKKEKIRFYNKPEIVSNVIGFVGMDDRGLEGLEYKFEKILKGENGYVSYQKKPNGKIYKHPLNKDKPAKNGKDIVLTIDERFQEAGYNIAKEFCEKYKAKKALVIVMETETGELYSVSEYPSYNSNLHAMGDLSTYCNYAATELFEPGSVFKLIIATAALEEKIDTSFIVKEENEDTLIISKKRITDSHDFGKLSFKEAFLKSSNIGFVNLGKMIGRKKIYDKIKDFNFSFKTGSGFVGEQKGLIPLLEKCREINFSTVCFGQGLSITALHLIAAYNSIANKGIYVNPKIIKSVNNKPYVKNISKRITNEKIANQLKILLTDVVEKGTGVKAKVDGINIAGKTGTAEKYIENKGYIKGYYISTFVGFFPVENPKFTILTLIDEPKTQYWASEITAPMFAEMVKRIVNFNDFRYFVKKEREMVQKWN